ncbi:MAG: hypothetical protein GX638_14700 [Crenarchaeota archaeon]|nr:hypothetical protein [Thermoproteota archaeon]
MALSKMAFSPSDGLRDTTTYPSKPASGADAREQIQGRLDEIKKYLNDNLTAEVDLIKTGLDADIANHETRITTIENNVPQSIESGHFPTAADDDKAVSSIWTIPSDYGATLTNLLGNDGEGKDLTAWTPSGTVTVENSEYFNMINGAYIYQDNVQQSVGKYYFIRADFEIKSYTSGIIGIQITDSGGWDNEVYSNFLSATTSGFISVGCKTSGRNLARLFLGDRTGSGTAEYNFKKIQQIEIPETEYNTLTVDQLLAKYPYVNNTVNWGGRSWICTSNATGAAVWKEISFV